MCTKLCKYGVHSITELIQKQTVSLPSYQLIGTIITGVLGLLIAHLQAICPKTSPPDVKYFDNSTKFEPRQLDGSSCGVFVSIVADYMVNGLDVNFTQVIISKYNF
ncbi:uncharacterized protein LOC114535237 isoform X1 [Dendronephthya gigantea]|uniref:uncharacterized protein LOC114535237 isoform X1 n=1 Tax=Dendronephthya gigantea TaxID=151771 RepID=UPI001069083A|nr:uncharacterized protein LOC114535237 isoform X1 [Dendronephthya gigantea]